MRALVMLTGVLLLAGCNDRPTYLPNSTRGYTAPALSTESGQLLIGRTACLLDAGHSDREKTAQSLINGYGAVDPAEAHRFVDEALAQCDYLRSAQVRDRLVELGEGKWVS